MRAVFFCAVVVCFLCVVLCHPTYYPDAKVKKLSPGEVPPFRSYHIHFLFEKTRSSDDCTGYDDAMRLRNQFIQYFNVPSFECQGLFDQGQMCAFSVSMGPFGPFVQPEFAFFVPYDQFHAVIQWAQQHHQQFSALIHPNSGYEREDHTIWALWAGAPRYLDLSLPEFSEQMVPYYNTSCRDEPATYPFPDNPPTPSPTAAHVRLVSLYPDTSTTISVTLNNQNAFPPVSHLDQTGYSDFLPTGQAIFCAVFTSSSTSSKDQSCVTQSITAGFSYSLFAWNGLLLFSEDSSNTPANQAEIRVVNALGQSNAVSVRRDGQVIINSLKSGEVSLYDNPAPNAQHFYEIVDSNSGKVIVTEPYFVYSGRAETIVAIGGIPSEENPNASTLFLSDGA